MDPLPKRRKEGGGEIVEVYGFAGWIASLVAYGEQLARLSAAYFISSTPLVDCAAFFPPRRTPADLTYQAADPFPNANGGALP